MKCLHPLLNLVIVALLVLTGAQVQAKSFGPSKSFAKSNPLGTSGTSEQSVAEKSDGAFDIGPGENSESESPIASLIDPLVIEMLMEDGDTEIIKELLDAPKMNAFRNELVINLDGVMVDLAEMTKSAMESAADSDGSAQYSRVKLVEWAGRGFLILLEKCLANVQAKLEKLVANAACEAEMLCYGAWAATANVACGAPLGGLVYGTSNPTNACIHACGGGGGGAPGPGGPPDDEPDEPGPQV